MTKKSIASKRFCKKVFQNASTVYLLGCLGWIGVWYLPDRQVYPSKCILWFPYISTYIILIFNMILRRISEEEKEDDNVKGKYKISNVILIEFSAERTEDDNVKGKYKDELEKMQFIERNAAHMITAITGVLIISAAISAMKNTETIPQEVIMFESAALICAVVGVLPKYWIPSTNHTLLNLLRHIKTVIYTFSISLFLGGLLLLLEWM